MTLKLRAILKEIGVMELCESRDHKIDCYGDKCKECPLNTYKTFIAALNGER